MFSKKYLHYKNTIVRCNTFVFKVRVRQRCMLYYSFEREGERKRRKRMKEARPEKGKRKRRWKIYYSILVSLLYFPALHGT